MNLEFHYYIIHFLSRKAGFSSEDANILAYSSQFVDNNIITYHVKTKERDYVISPTQNYGFWVPSFPKEIYLPFHFFPGDTPIDGSTRRDRKTNPLNTTPNSSKVKALLLAALHTRNLYRVGIALHTFADSWAHQNFSGINEPWNVLDEGSLIPPIGHAQAIKKPDDLNSRWVDTRLIHPDISNRERFLTAAGKIYKYLATYNRRSFNDLELVLWKLEDILGPPGRKPLEERLLDYTIEADIPAYNRKEWLNDALYLPPEEVDESVFSGYDKLLWLKDALLYRNSIIRKIPIKPRGPFSETHLFKWHEASRDHRREAHRILKGILQ